MEDFLGDNIVSTKIDFEFAESLVNICLDSGAAWRRRRLGLLRFAMVCVFLVEEGNHVFLGHLPERDDAKDDICAGDMLTKDKS